jgi:hypothetical protein
MLEGFFTSAAQTFMAEDGHHGGSFEEHQDSNGAGETPQEGFAPMYAPASGMQGDLAGMIGRVLALLFVLLLISFFGQYFWNTYVTTLFTVTKPAKSVMQILGLFIFVRLMFP